MITDAKRERAIELDQGARLYFEVPSVGHVS
jgi:hypothetical protein